MKKRTFEVSISIEVKDEAELYEYAMRRSIEDGLSEEAAEEMLGSKEEPDISACLRMVIDPGTSPSGTSILDSSCEENVFSFEADRQNG